MGQGGIRYKGILYPRHQMQEYLAHNRWHGRVILGLVLGILALFYLAPLTVSLWNFGWTERTARNIGPYLQRMASDLDYIEASYRRFFAQNPIFRAGTLGGIVLLQIAIAGIFARLNPHRPYPMIHGDSRWADEGDIAAMEKLEMFGVEQGRYLHLGLTPQRRKFRLIETVSVLVLAPPGTGKTAGYVVPSMQSTPDCTFIVNDPKPELFLMTSGYRSTVSKVFMIDWSKTDQPDRGIFYPRFNFIAREIVPDEEGARNTYLDTVAQTLLPDGKEGRADYFTNKGRAALVGFLHFVVAQVNDHDDYDDIPTNWHGREASIPMLVDFIVEGQMAANRKSEAEQKQAAARNQYYSGDPMKDWIQKLVDKAIALKFPHRTVQELSTLINMADRERSGVLGTMDQALLPFKNPTTAERTSACDFLPADLRGIPDETGKWWPMTLYICVNQAEASAFANVTALLYEVLSKELLSYGPNEVNRRGRKLGPFAVHFMMDEFAKLPRIDAVLTGPDLGRSKKTFYSLIAQAYGQIAKIYSREDVEVIDNTTAVKLVFPQNDPTTIEKIIKMVGSTTQRTTSISRTRGFSKAASEFSANHSESEQRVDLLSVTDVTNMPERTHFLILQKFNTRPLRLKTPLWFRDPELRAQVYSLRDNSGPNPAGPLPANSIAARQQEIERLARIQAGKEQTDEVEKVFALTATLTAG